MIRVKLPMQCADGKQIYNMTLQIINKKSPQFANFIHGTQKYNPFSTVLPDIVNILDPALEAIFKQAPGAEIIVESDRKEAPLKLNNRIKLRFEKTFFKQLQASYPLPDPWRIIKNWKNRWNSLYPDKITIELPIEHARRKEQVELHHVNIKSCGIKIADYRTHYGFSGHVCLKWLGSEKELRELWMLARFAEFAGTGAKTTMGCGITEVMES